MPARPTRAAWPSDAVRDDAGAGGVLALGIVAAVVLAALAWIGAGGVLVAHAGARAAADAAALAAADALAGWHLADPCALAAAVAAANGGMLSRCTLAGGVADVQVGRVYLGLDIRADARAGPPVPSSG